MVIFNSIKFRVFWQSFYYDYITSCRCHSYIGPNINKEIMPIMEYFNNFGFMRRVFSLELI